MSTPLISDRLWEIIAPLLPPEPPKPKGGRPRSLHRRPGSCADSIVVETCCAWSRNLLAKRDEEGAGVVDEVVENPETHREE
jgi:hypothetical protein